ncbi:MAG TPA: hypothetical protein VIF62_20330 [Labilithrix sp.]
MRTCLSLLACAIVGCTVHPAEPGSDDTPTATLDRPTSRRDRATEAMPNANLHIDAAFDLHPRSTCFRGAGVTTHVANDTPQSALGMGESCVETGHVGAGGAMLSDVDNPRVWTNAPLGAVTTPAGGSLAESYTRSAATGFAFGHGDVRAAVTSHGGVGNEPSTNLLPWTPQTGSWSSSDGSFLALTEGLRLGRSAIDFDLQVEPALGGFASAATPVSVALDPKVILVPIQVYLFVAPGESPKSSLAPDAQAALWDRVPSFGTTTQETEGGGVVDTTLHPMSWVVEGGDAEPAHASGQRVPDDVWAPCGIQFRLMKVVTLEVGPELLKPSGHTLDNSALFELRDAIQKDPSYDARMLTVVFAPYCADFDQGDFGGPFPGQSLVDDHLSCARYASSGGVLAHELGHVILGTTEHPTCAGDYATNVMCAQPQDNYEVDIRNQCSQARTHLSATEMGKMFAPLDPRVVEHRVTLH